MYKAEQMEMKEFYDICKKIGMSLNGDSVKLTLCWVGDKAVEWVTTGDVGKRPKYL